MLIINVSFPEGMKKFRKSNAAGNLWRRNRLSALWRVDPFYGGPFIRSAIFVNSLSETQGVLQKAWGASMGKELSFITVIGLDKKGIVAKISRLLYRHNVNIEDIAQKIMEKHFVMTMLIDVANMKVPMDRLRAALEKIGKELNLKVQIQHENVFKMMHRV
jgi:ACT domain-containing protein